MTFGQYLRETRKSKGLTAQELGNKVNTTGQYITQMEQGKLKAPNREMAHKLADALSVNFSEFWGIAALERHWQWCKREGINPDQALTFFQAANFDRKKIKQKRKSY